MRDAARVRDVFLLFLRLGATAFGGPAVHVALMRDEAVTRRRWLTDAEFLDLLAATNLIPGPNSTEMAMHVGLRRAGWWGFAAAGVGFIAPAFALVLGLAMAYQRFGHLPDARGVMAGLAPVVVVIVGDALRRFCVGRAWRPWQGVVLAAAAMGALGGVHEIALLAVAAAVGVASSGAWRDRALAAAGATAVLVAAMLPWTLPPADAAPEPFSLAALAVVFLKVGSVLFGSGYVLFAFLRADLVERTRWLGDQQLLDAIAVGQFTPGPLSTTATFVGYLLGGTPGALVATGAMFAPAFLFVAMSHPLVPRMRASARLGRALDAVVVGSLGLMVAVVIRLAESALTTPAAWAIAGAAVAGLAVWRVPPTALLAAGGIAGWLGAWMRG